MALAQVEEAKTFFGANVTKGGLGWESGFWVNNLNDDPVELTYFFAKNGVNAARVTTTKKTILSGAREFIRPVPLGQAGMVGLLSDEQLHYRGILGIVDGVSPSDSDADDYDELTIVDSSMAYFGGEIADVEAPDGLTHLVVTNFSSSRNSCVAVVYDSTNELIGEQTMSMKPTSLKKFRGVVPLVASTADGHGRVEVECARPFYPQGILQHVAIKNIASLSPQPGLVPPEDPRRSR